MSDERADHGEFEEWFVDAWPSLVRALGAWCGDMSDGAEAASEACARAFAQWDRVGAMDSPSGWVFRVGQSQLRRQFRRRRRESSGSGGPGAEVVRHEETAAKLADREVLLEALQGLPPRQREAVVLRYLLDLTQAQVAEQMSMAPGTAAATLHAARRNLRELIATNEEVGHAHR